MYHVFRKSLLKDVELKKKKSERTFPLKFRTHRMLKICALCKKNVIQTGNKNDVRIFGGISFDKRDTDRQADTEIDS